MSYEKFLAWQHCHRLALLTYRLTQGFPKTELYGITSQMRRAAASAAATIAEGASKRGQPEFRRFLDMALGSLSELTYFGRLARDLSIPPLTGARDLARAPVRGGMERVRSTSRTLSIPPLTGARDLELLSE